MLTGFRRVLVLAPHTDDGELGAGATLHRLHAEGAELHYVAFSGCEESVPPGFPRDILRHEVIEATSCLGFSSANVRVLDYKVRRFNEARQDILEDMILLRRSLDPDLVFMPSLQDVHQDHGVIAVEGRRAFKSCTLLSYELPWNSFGFEPAAFVAVARENMDAKSAAVARYRSQGQRPYMQPEVIESWARFRGLSGGGTWAEAFEVVRWFIG
jgi:LmbE family N-acetylglucosaminyl deacetylase